MSCLFRESLTLYIRGDYTTLDDMPGNMDLKKLQKIHRLAYS